ncbi:MAG: FAD-dependent monooxygenase [Rubrivivax sp.]|nr:FAD-dependent monooxygenase [Rubrivivax sp.]
MTQRLARICVVGAGLAGLACALAAAGRGLQVQLFDEAEQPCSAPAHIEVVPNMLRGLVALGVGDECVRAGFAYRGIDVIDRHGRHLHELVTEHLAGARYPAALGIRHADLHQVLERAALRRGVALRRGSRVHAVHEREGAAAVELAGGKSAPADLVVLAAGAGSALRAACFPHARAASVLDQAWWYALLPRPVDLDRPLVAFGSAGQRAVLVPVRHDLAGIALTGPMPVQQRLSPAGHLREALASFAPRLRTLSAHFGEGTPVVRRTARSGLLDLPWHHGAVLAVGDGAHAFPPHFGQAAAQAIEDAQVLADLLGAVPDRQTLFEAFQRRRAERVRLVHDITTTAARWDLKPEGDADLSLLMDRLMRTVAQPA